MPLHPNLADLYRGKVAELSQTLADPDVRTPALEIIRGLIERVTVRMDTSRAVMLELEGAITAMIGLAQPGAERLIDQSSVKVVAGAGFNHYLRPAQVMMVAGSAHHQYLRFASTSHTTKTLPARDDRSGLFRIAAYFLMSLQWISQNYRNISDCIDNRDMEDVLIMVGLSQSAETYTASYRSSVLRTLPQRARIAFSTSSMIG